MIWLMLVILLTRMLRIQFANQIYLIIIQDWVGQEPQYVWYAKMYLSYWSEWSTCTQQSNLGRPLGFFFIISSWIVIISSCILSYPLESYYIFLNLYHILVNLIISSWIYYILLNFFHHNYSPRRGCLRVPKFSMGS